MVCQPSPWGLRMLGCVCAYSLSCVRPFATRWPVARQAPLSMVILRARILERVAIPFSRGSSQPGDKTQVSHIEGNNGILTIPPSHLLCIVVMYCIFVYAINPHCY